MADFFTLCRTPNLACEVTLQPLRRYNLDAAIIFSDILVIPQAMGLEVQMVKGVGPVLPSPLLGPEELTRLTQLKDMDLKKELGYVFTAITLTRHNLDGLVPLIGFSGAPWTLMAYMIEGKGAKTYSTAKSWFYKHPEASHQLLGYLTELIIEYLIQQVVAGAQMLEVFDSWAGDLTPEVFNEFVFPTLRDIASGVKEGLRSLGLSPVPMTIFPRCAHFAFEKLAKETEYDVVSVDWAISPEDARKLVGSGVTLQGNLDSAVFFASDEKIIQETRNMVRLSLSLFVSLSLSLSLVVGLCVSLSISVYLSLFLSLSASLRLCLVYRLFSLSHTPHYHHQVTSFGAQKYIANLGHGMLPSHEPRSVETFVEAVHSVSKELNTKQ